MAKELSAYHYLAIEASIQASRAIMDVYASEFTPVVKKDGSPVTIADHNASEIIHSLLAQTGFPITGEEVLKADFSVRKDWHVSWCVDPLDGTKEFIKRNGEFVVNIALIENQEPVFGVIASPVAQKVIFGGLEFGAFIADFSEVNHHENWSRFPNLKALNSPLVVVSSRSHFDGDLGVFIEGLEKRFGTLATAKMGSALKFFDLVKGTADVYPRFAPTMEWDIAAGHAIYRAVGGEVVDIIFGQPLIYNKSSLLNPHFIAFKKIAFGVIGIKESI